MNYEIARNKMVQNQIVSPPGDRKPVTDRRVIDAMLKIPRHIFVQEAFSLQAYNDSSLPIGEKQTISQPYMVALMTEMLALTGSEKVLEIGTGSGYQTAVLATLAARVCTLERIRPLALQARKCLDSLGLFNVMLKINDGDESPVGWEEESPFDAIIVTAGAPELPQLLIEQLAPGGRLVIPVGNEEQQRLVRVVRQPDGEIVTDQSIGCRFVPLIGRHGWNAGRGIR